MGIRIGDRTETGLRNCQTRSEAATTTMASTRPLWFQPDPLPAAAVNMLPIAPGHAKGCPCNPRSRWQTAKPSSASAVRGVQRLQSASRPSGSRPQPVSKKKQMVLGVKTSIDRLASLRESPVRFGSLECSDRALAPSRGSFGRAPDRPS